MTAVAAPAVESHDGRIAMRVRIGVTGHRRLADEEALALQVCARLKTVAETFPATETTPVRFKVLSALAEGADRLVVREARETLGRQDVELAVILPLDPGDYAADFDTEASRAEFHDYLRDATSVVQAAVVPGDTREQAYWRAGREIVDRSDVLIAVWDGQPAHGTGGTGEVVAYARRSGVAVLTVPTTAGQQMLLGEPALRGSPRLRRARDALRRLRAYNAADPALPRLERELEHQHAWTPQSTDSTARELFTAVAAWALPHFVRAELRARRAQRRYHHLVDALFGLAALAVAGVGYQISFQPERPRLALFETVSLVLLVFAFSIGRKARLHEAWIGYRSLAEAFRSSLFIAAIGAGDASPDGVPTTIRHEPWFQRAFSEAWARRPSVTPEGCDVAALRDMLAESWIGDQIAYHRDSAERAERRHRVVTSVVQAMLAVAILLSIFHAFEVFEEPPWVPDLLEFMAIVLPGVSAALTGHREHRQYRLNAERSRRTAERLRRVKLDLEAAPNLTVLRRLAREAQTIMVEENRDWFGVAELQELEVSL